MGIAIASALLDEILAHAASEPDREVCGLLFGDGSAITSARPAPNIAADPARTFEIDPALLIAAHKAARSGGPRLIGHYHSHPNGRLIPSLRDADAAEPGMIWLIVADGAAALFRAQRGGGIEGMFCRIALDVRPSPLA
jgi:proteasome lid subunit RPN8/RPN11